MKKRYVQILIGLCLINIVSYGLFSKKASETIVYQKYLDFTQRRLENKWHTKASEYINVSSCNDEFFKNIEAFEAIVSKSKHFQTIRKADATSDILTTIQAQTDSLKSTNSIIYKVCSKSTVPGFFKSIAYQYFYADAPSNFHSMHYNGHMEGCTSTYLWLFGFWMELDGNITTLIQ